MKIPQHRRPSFDHQLQYHWNWPALQPAKTSDWWDPSCDGILIAQAQIIIHDYCKLLLASVQPSSRYLSWHSRPAWYSAPSPSSQHRGVLYIESNVAVLLIRRFISKCSVSNLTSSTDQSEIGSQLTMDLESVFDGPLSTGSSGKKSGVSVSVWQAEVALRLSEWGISMISDEWFDERFISMVIPNLWNIRFSS